MRPAIRALPYPIAAICAIAGIAYFVTKCMQYPVLLLAIPTSIALWGAYSAGLNHEKERDALKKRQAESRKGDRL